MKKKILVTARSFGKEPKNFKYFTDRGYEIAENPYYGKILTEDELCEVLRDVDGCLIGLEEMTEKVYQAASQLVVAQKMGIGVDNMAVAAAAAHHVAVTNVPAATTQSVADLTFGLLLNISKKITYTNRRVMSGMWPMDFSNDVYGKTIGIIGFGRIGQAVAKRAKGFDMKVLAFDFIPNHAAAEALGVELVGRLLTYQAAVAKGESRRYTKLAAVAKLFTSEHAMKTTTKVVQLFGGYGYTKDYPVERMMRDAKITEIYEGTSEVQRIVISANMGL